jgi:hypothetical protein
VTKRVCLALGESNELALTEGDLVGVETEELLALTVVKGRDDPGHWISKPQRLGTRHLVKLELDDARLTHAVECNSTARGNSRKAPPYLLPQA